VLRFAGKVDHHQGERRKTQQLDSVRGFVHCNTPIWFEQEHGEDQDRCDRSQQTRQPAEEISDRNQREQEYRRHSPFRSSVAEKERQSKCECAARYAD